MTNNNARRAHIAVDLVVEGLRARRERAHQLRLRAGAGDHDALQELSEL